MKVVLEENDLKQVLSKINPKIKLEEWTEEGIIINSEIEGFKGKFILGIKLDNLSRKAEIDLKVREINF